MEFGEVPFTLYPTECSDSSSSTSIHGNIEILPEILFRSKPTININANDDAFITFQVNNLSKLLSLHLNTLGHFISIEILSEDNQHKIRKFILTNKKSKIIINEKECTVPMKIGEFWQHLSIDMKSIMKSAFGLEFYRCIQIKISGRCKLLSMYLHNEACADVTLPSHLQVFEHI